MKPEEKKETTQQAQDPPKRGWREVLSGRNAELDLDDEAAVGSYLDESFQAYDRGEEERRRFNDLMSSDPRAAGILTGMASGKDDEGGEYSLAGYLFDKYEEELRAYYEGEMTKEEALARVKEKEAAQIKEAADAEARRKTADDNLAKSDAALTQAARKANVDEANLSDMLEWLYGDGESREGFIHRVIRHELDEEDWSRLIHAFNVEADAEAARNEGRTAMRNERAQPHRNAAKAPTYMGGGGGGDTQPKESQNPTADKYASMKRRF
jgi:hypothetical protein